MLGAVSERTPLRRGQLETQARSAIVSSSQNGNSILLLWLNMLGWQVEVDRDGKNLVGLARHCAEDGDVLRVGGCAPTRDELAFQLFEAVMKIVEARGQRLQRPLLAA